MSTPNVSQEDKPIVTSCSDQPFQCARCKSLLGFVDSATKSEIRVKYRDLYIRCKDPEHFEITCRSCGHFNRLEKL